MGHADKSTTLNTYSHWFNALDKTDSEEITQNIKAEQARYYADLSVQAGGNQAIVAKIEALMSERQA